MRLRPVLDGELFERGQRAAGCFLWWGLVACSPSTTEAPPVAAPERVTAPALSRDGRAPEPGAARALRVADVPVEVPSGCRLAESRPGGGRIECARAILDWENRTSSDIDAKVASMTEADVTVLERFSISCQIGAAEGEGEIVTIEADGHEVATFLCVVPHHHAHAAVLCIGYDARRKPTSDPPVPEPCNQVIAWQPIVVAPP